MIKLIRKTGTFIFILILAFIFYFVFVKPRIGSIDNTNISGENTGAGYYVERVVDGDTFVLSDKSRVRLLGIDAPEVSESSKMERESERTGQDKETIRKLGESSARYLRELVEGKRVMLTKENDYEDKDQYGRLLRYAYLEDGTFVNGKMVEEGYAQVFRKYDLSRKSELLALEKDARENERGLWGTVEGTKQFR
ncbi:MAG: thermonuclease family protein [Ignavibacteriae bacterium]|nr:thermonuclease family protein [Ignavibacteriota bacterium]MCB9242697.1 thermonuclease family protein [Ignavibacteriales bacterium]